MLFARQGSCLAASTASVFQVIDIRLTARGSLNGSKSHLPHQKRNRDGEQNCELTNLFSFNRFSQIRSLL